MPTTTSLVLILDRPRGRFANVVSGLGALWAGELPAMLWVDAYYDVTRDCVAIIMHYPESLLTDAVRRRIAIVARAAGVELLDPEQLHEDERRRLEGADSDARVNDQPVIA